MKTRKRSNRDIALQSAATLFLTQGFQVTSMDDIVAHSGVSKTNIYYHFNSKDDLLRVIVDQLISHYEQRIQHVLSNSGASVLDKLERLCIILHENAGEHDYLGGCPFLTLYTQIAPEASEVRASIKRFFERQLHAIEGLLADGIARQEIRAELPVQSTAALLLSSIEGALFLAQAADKPFVLQEIFPALATMLK